MRWLSIERDNVTHLSEPDAEGNSFMASFEFFPFHEGANFAVYKGILNGHASRRGQFCVVKTLVDKPAEYRDLEHVIKRAREAQRLATSFNELIGYRVLWFANPSLARLKRVSDFNGAFRCFVPHDKRLVTDEYVVMELLIDGKFQVFNCNNGSIPYVARTDTRTMSKSKSKKKNKCEADFLRNSCPSGRRHLGPNNMAQAFGHYTWFITGTSVVCGLEGVFADPCYCFTTPVIHSLSSSFGATDGGPEAIAQFFATHRCTNICQQWPIFTPGSSNAKKQINFFESSAKIFHKTSIPNTNIFNDTDNVNLASLEKR